MAVDTTMSRPRPGSTRWLFAAVWLVFLVYPVAGIVNSDISVWSKAYGLSVTGVFAVTYVAACIKAMPFRSEASEADGRRLAEKSYTPVVYFVVLLTIALMGAPVLGVATASFAPYLMALAMFAFPIRAAVITTVTLVVVAIGVQFTADQIDLGLCIPVLVSGVILIASRFAQIRELGAEGAAEELRRLDDQLAILAERDRVARDVHDVLGHTLTVMTVKTELALRLVDVDPKRAKTELAEIHSMSRQALAEVRSTVGGLRTPDLKAELASAATALAAAEIEADLPESATELPVGRATLFAWVIRESVTNVVRHSGAQRCRIVVDSSSVEVCDDGRGMPSSVVGSGLRGLRDRVVGAGGQLRIDSTGPGTAVRVLMP